MRLSLSLALACALLLTVSASSSPAGATTLSFFCLTNNLASDCAIGEAQLTVEVSDLGGGSIRFEFQNAGPEAAVISEIYFDDGSLLALATIINGPGVDFEQDANPPDLPGGQEASPPFEVTQGFLAESTPPPPANGVGPGQYVQLDFTLQAGKTFDDVIAELASGELRIGIHVIAFESGGSESLINVPVPEPGIPLLLATGLGAATLRRRSRRPTA